MSFVNRSFSIEEYSFLVSLSELLLTAYSLAGGEEMKIITVVVVGSPIYGGYLQ